VTDEELLGYKFLTRVPKIGSVLVQSAFNMKNPRMFLVTQEPEIKKASWGNETLLWEISLWDLEEGCMDGWTPFGDVQGNLTLGYREDGVNWWLVSEPE
jgi:hypothetical protein